MVSGPIRGMQRLEPLFMRPPCGIHVDQRQKGRSCRDLLHEGCTHFELRYNWGFSALELAGAGLSASEQAEVSVPTREIASTGRYRAEECRLAGCTVMDMLSTTKYTPSMLIAAGYGPRDFRAAGLTAGAIRSLGFSRTQLIEAGIDAGDTAYMRPPPRNASSSRSSRASRPRTAQGDDDGRSGSRPTSKAGAPSQRRPQTAQARRTTRPGVGGLTISVHGSGAPAAQAERPRSAHGATTVRFRDAEGTSSTSGAPPAVAVVADADDSAEFPPAAVPPSSPID